MTRLQFVRGCRYAILALLVLCQTPGASAQADLPFAAKPLNDGYRDMYNLDFDSAHGEFAIWMAQHPDDPLGPISDAAAFLFSEFDRTGVLDIELFADNSRFSSRKAPPPDSAIRAGFDQRTKQADDLADAVLRNAPADPWALFTKALVCGLRSDYAELIDDSNFTALRLSQKSSKYAALALKAKPDLYDAHLASGIENYMLSLKPAPVRWMVNLTGGSTNKDLGIKEVRITAERGHFLAPFARLMLAVAELRDGNMDKARSILRGLASEFPRNTLYAAQLKRLH